MVVTKSGEQLPPAAQFSLKAWPSAGSFGKVTPSSKARKPVDLGGLLEPPPGEFKQGTAYEMSSNKVIPATGRRHGSREQSKLAPVIEPPAGGATKGASNGRPKTKSALNLLSVRQVGNPVHEKVLAFLDGRVTTIIMTIFLFYALFGDDVRVALFPKSADTVFFSFSLVALILFTLELLLNSIARRDYVLRFYFWLDFVATLSLIPDIGWFWDPIVDSGDDSSGDGGTTNALQAGRASRAGTKAGRIVRIVRLVRLIRIVKLYKHVGGKREKEGGDPVATEPSQVGKILADLTTRRLIVIVLAMVIVLPFFDPNGLDDVPNQHETLGLHTMHRLQFANLNELATLNNIREYVRESGDLLYLQLYGVSDSQMDTYLRNMYFTNDDGANVTESPSTGWTYAVRAVRMLLAWSRVVFLLPFASRCAGLPPALEQDLCTPTQIGDTLRSAEYSEIKMWGCFDNVGFPTSQEASDCQSRAFFSNKGDTEYEAAMNIAKTFFVMIVLSVGAIMFTRIAEQLVIGPIERMVNMVKKLAEDPLASVSHDDELQHHHAKTSSTYETALLETTLHKIGALLQVGFGEAGTEIIRQNMGHGGNLNPLIAGRKMTGIFGFCDIRQFTDATECLQEEVMVFVNRIGEIVHEATHQYSGAANKNIGDAFLLVWRMPATEPGDPLMAASVAGSERNHSMALTASRGGDAIMSGDAVVDVESTVDMESKEMVDRATLSASQLADNALYAFLKVVVDIANSNENGQLRQYRNDPRLASRFPDGYSVKMGYGLHLGWAIEGAIGSRLKIDASYLSPNVNMASRLEAATKQYGTPILMSHLFANSLSPAAYRFCRRIDKVTVKGSEDPVELFTFDVTDIPDYLGGTSPRPNPASHRACVCVGVVVPLRSLSCVCAAVNSQGRAKARFGSDPNVAFLQRSIDKSFFSVFERGVELYLGGAWGDSTKEIRRALELKPGDGPCQTLLRVMGEAAEAPDSWAGVRNLTEK